LSRSSIKNQICPRGGYTKRDRGPTSEENAFFTDLVGLGLLSGGLLAVALGPSLLTISRAAIAGLVEDDEENEVGDDDAHAKRVDKPKTEIRPETEMRESVGNRMREGIPFVIRVAVASEDVVPDEARAVETDDEDELDDLHLGDVL